MSQALAEQRARTISRLSYDLALEIPEQKSDPISGTVTAHFDLANPAAEQPLVLDFRQDSVSVRGVRANGAEAAFSLVNGHILVESARLNAGSNEVTVRFLAGDGSLNRREDHLYTLFVPDRASVAFPCFDQPDLKARYRLSLDIPEKWSALANGSVLEDRLGSGRRLLRFAETQPLSTYQLAFAAGVFEIEERQLGDRVMRLFHRETNRDVVARNLDAIFDLHARSLDWLEDYTGIKYPYQKFDFAAMPAFQYGGMEHPGAIFYRDRGLWLDAAPTLSQTLSRANTIAHETAHMWFGNLVTMRWFDDVWTKEVYANFMAGKIANPIFPEIDHELRFFLRHYPAAYSIDRTAGTNPIRQPLENLIDAGTLYGPIIYEKAPIVMRQLEDLLGEEELRQGLQTYLQRYSYANASWPELVAILDDLTEIDLAAWSRVWVEEGGRPKLEVRIELEEDDRIKGLDLEQSDPAGRGRIWAQPIRLGYRRQDERIGQSFFFDSASRSLTGLVGKPAPDYVLPNADSRPYGFFALDSRSREHLLEDLSRIHPDLERAVALQDLWEEMLEGQARPALLADSLSKLLAGEANELLIDQQLGFLESLFWDFLTVPQREARRSDWEALLWDRLENSSADSLRSSFFTTYQNIATTPEALIRLREIWQKRRGPAGLELSEADLISLASSLTLKLGQEEILEEQMRRVSNPDRLARMRFLKPALSADPAVRDAFFDSLAEDRNRDREPWVAQGLAFLNHPLRGAEAVKYLPRVLELLEEIQRTGDIFFPSSWLNSAFDGHSSEEALKVVQDFLAAHPDYPPRLRAKILQATDLLVRKVHWRIR